MPGHKKNPIRSAINRASWYRQQEKLYREKAEEAEREIAELRRMAGQDTP